MSKNIVIVNYNTQEFVDKLIMSINLFVKDAKIIIFDNSDMFPFINTFDNVEIIDNTCSQIIDFDEFLSRYPSRLQSSAKENGYASAKHCYTIQRCIDLIDDNFMLMDSDILLKKDISELFDDRYLYVGGVGKQTNGLKRVLPFLCYINVKMCKENNVNYFDERYMHGLCFTGYTADAYDTGGGFYINAEPFEHKIVDIEEYMIHYGHGSWNKNGYKYQLTKEEFFERNKSCWSVQ